MGCQQSQYPEMILYSTFTTSLHLELIIMMSVAYIKLNANKMPYTKCNIKKVLQTIHFRIIKYQ